MIITGVFGFALCISMALATSGYYEYLQSNDHYVIGSETPIYMASGDHLNDRKLIDNYKKIPFPAPKLKPFLPQSSSLLSSSVPYTRVRRSPGLATAEIKINNLSMRIVIQDFFKQLKGNSLFNYLLSNNAQVSAGDILYQLRLNGYTKNFEDPYVLVNFTDSKAAVDIKKLFQEILPQSASATVVVGESRRSLAEIVESLYNNGFASEYKKKFIPLHFSGMGSLVINVDKIKEFEDKYSSWRYTLSNGISLDRDTILAALKKHGVSFETEGDVAYPEILLLVDYESYNDLFKRNVDKLANYFLAYWNAVDLRFSDIANPKIRLNVAGIVVAEDKEFSDYMLSNSDSIKNFLNENQETFSHRSYDLAIAFKYRQPSHVGTGTVFAGSSHIEGSACSTDYPTIGEVVYEGAFRTLNSAALLVAASLGVAKTDEECPGYEGTNYIMRLRPDEDSLNRFSQCSKDQLSENLKKYRASCLYNKPNVGNVYPKILPGQVLSDDDLCAITVGPQFTATEDLSANNKCIAQCYYSDKYRNLNSFYELKKTDGSTCGHKQICLDNQCVAVAQM